MAMTERSTVVGVFDDRDEAELAIGALRRAGFRDADIGFAVRGGTEAGTIPVHPIGAEGGTGAATGAVTGGVVGGLLGALAAGLIPGIGPVLAGGLLAGVLGGGLVGAVAGGLLGALTGMGVPEEEARYYDQEFQAGRAILTVKADDRFAEAQAILRRLGAYDVETRDEPAAPRSPTGTPTRLPAGTHAGTAGVSPAPAAGPNRTALEPKTTLPLRREELRPHRQMADVGQVQVGKQVVSEPRSIEVSVRHDEVEIERRSVERQPTNRPIGEGQTIRVPLRKEHVSLEKLAEDTEQVSATVRREEPRLETEGELNVLRPPHPTR